MNHYCNNCMIVQVSADHYEMIEPGSEIKTESMLLKRKEVVIVKRVNAVEVCADGTMLIHVVVSRRSLEASA